MPILLNHLWQETVKGCVSCKYIILVDKTVYQMNSRNQEIKTK